MQWCKPSKYHIKNLVHHEITITENLVNVQKKNCFVTMVVERQLSGYRTWQILHLGNVLELFFKKSVNECNWDSNPKIWVKFQNWKKMNVHVINWSERKKITKMIETRYVMWVMILVQAVHRIIIIVISILVENLAWVLLLLLLLLL